MTDHPDLVELTELADGELAGEQRAAVAAHVIDCAQCRSTQSRLADVRTALHSLGQAPDATMPADVADRISAALATASTGVTEPAPVRPLHRRRWPTVGLAVAASLVLLLGALIAGGVALQSGRHQGGSATSSSADQGAAAPQTTRITASGRNYSQSTTAGFVQSLLRGDASTAASPNLQQPNREGSGGSSADTQSAQARLRNGSTLAACVRAVTDTQSAARPLLVDFASWQGEPAAVIVLPGQTADRVDVYVVPPDCGPQHTTFYSFAEVPR